MISLAEAVFCDHPPRKTLIENIKNDSFLINFCLVIYLNPPKISIMNCPQDAPHTPSFIPGRLPRVRITFFRSCQRDASLTAGPPLYYGEPAQGLFL